MRSRPLHAQANSLILVLLLAIPYYYLGRLNAELAAAELTAPKFIPKP
jgi:hypothetical protein